MKFHFFVRFGHAIELAITEGPEHTRRTQDLEARGFQRMDYPSFRVAWQNRDHQTFRRLGLQPLLNPLEQ